MSYDKAVEKASELANRFPDQYEFNEELVEKVLSGQISQRVLNKRRLEEEEDVRAPDDVRIEQLLDDDERVEDDDAFEQRQECLRQKIQKKKACIQTAVKSSILQKLEGFIRTSKEASEKQMAIIIRNEIKNFMNTEHALEATSAEYTLRVQFLESNHFKVDTEFLSMLYNIQPDN